ncbi:MAG: hypothetical protein LC104_09635 [Bacteroidales bacterium]|nr:hypothetical protein [Bacteroidales bacterium]
MNRVAFRGGTAINKPLFASKSANPGWSLARCSTFNCLIFTEKGRFSISAVLFAPRKVHLNSIKSRF